MNEKLNIAEILKDCPKGMELDCAIYENVEFDYVEQNPEARYPIHCLMKTNDGYNTMVFTNNGCYDRHPNAKCVIFPKGKTTWEGFQRPFKDGDVVVCKENEKITQMFILKSQTDEKRGYCYTGYDFRYNEFFEANEWYFDRLATEEEKQKLFDAIKANGYKWNAETKTLDKLIQPKFKVGDRIKHKEGYISGVIIKIDDKSYKLKHDSNSIYFTNIKCQDDYVLVPNKFDITTLKPFESRVLVRSTNNDIWRPAIWIYRFR